jgi:hypothetical protein
MSRQQHRFHGDPARFDVVAKYINDRYGNSIEYIADVAGGQGMLARVLNKRYRYQAEVIDPRGNALKGVPHRIEEFSDSLAGYYDLIVGIHADEATRAVAQSALVKPTILIPCCNFWSEEKLGQYELIEAIEAYYDLHHVAYERTTLDFNGPKNIALVTAPSGHPS